MPQYTDSILKALDNFENLYSQIRDISISSNDDDDGNQDDDIYQYELANEEEKEEEEGESNLNKETNSDETTEEFNNIQEDESEDTIYYDESTRFSPLVNDWVTESEYESDCYEIVDYFLVLLIELWQSIKHGQIKNFNQKAIEVKDLLNNDFLSEVLLRNLGKDSDDINNILFSIIDNINFNEFFENEIYSLPNNISELTEEILLCISQNPELMHKLEPRLFEELIRRIFTKFKIEAKLTKQTRDGGFDIIAFEDKIYSQNSYIIECKRFSPTRKVSIDVVQRLYGIKQSNKLTKAFLVTSSSFTKPAINWAKQHCWELELKDHKDIAQWLNLFWH